MKIFKIVILSMVLMFTCSNAGSVSNPTQIINGKPMHFGTDTANNWYSFTVEKDTNIIILGSNKYGSSLNSVKIYDVNLNNILDKNYLKSSSLYIAKGRYYIVISESTEGTFAVYSKNISNAAADTPQLGSIVHPYVPKNGVNINFGINTATNVYYFEMKSSGNVLISGSNKYGSSLNLVKVFNINLEEVLNESYVESTTKNLAKGKYYLVISESTEGTFSIYSSSLGSTPHLPPVNSNYANGYNAGKQYCIDNPRSCGYQPQVVVIPF